MAPDSRPLLVLINGPSAAGKSTLARTIGSQLRQLGHSNAVIDIDEVSAMGHFAADLHWTIGWGLTREVHAKLANGWLQSGLRIVIAEGGFFDADERAPLERFITEPHDEVWFSLTVDFEEAHRRALRDPTRGLTKDRDFLKRGHDRFRAGLAQLLAGGASDIVIDTGPESEEDLASRIINDFVLGPVRFFV